MPFELLIIVYVVYVLYQNFFGEKKRKERAAQREELQTVEESPYSSDSTDWDQAMKELESIFSGEPAVSKQPEPVTEPVFIEESKPARPQYSSASQSAEMERQRKLASVSVSSSGLSEKLIETENPIYRSTNNVYEMEADVSRTGAYNDLINDPESIRKAVVMREILGRPKALQKDRSIF
jgi:hypothetical protein